MWARYFEIVQGAKLNTLLLIYCDVYIYTPSVIRILIFSRCSLSIAGTYCNVVSELINSRVKSMNDQSDGLVVFRCQVCSIRCMSLSSRRVNIQDIMDDDIRDTI